MKKLAVMLLLSLGALWPIGPASAVTISDQLCFNSCNSGGLIVSLVEGRDAEGFAGNQLYLTVFLDIYTGSVFTAVGLVDGQGLSDIVYYTPDGDTPWGQAPNGQQGLYMMSDTEASLMLAFGGPTTPETGGVQDLSSYFGGAPVFASSDLVESTPLPSTWLMLLSGFVGLGYFAYRGTKKNAAALAAA